MTSLITELGRHAVTSNTYAHFSGTVGVIAVMLLIALLLQKELVRAVGGIRLRNRMRVLNIAIVPLGISFVTLIVARFLIDILHYG